MNISYNKMLKITAQSQHKNLFRAVLRYNNFDFETLQDVTQHGMQAGYGQFVYYSDTTKFFNANRANILTLCKEYADELGYKSIYEFIAGFNCLKGFYQTDIVEALCGRGDCVMEVKNALAWFAAEECARFIVDAIEEG